METAVTSLKHGPPAAYAILEASEGDQMHLDIDEPKEESTLMKRFGTLLTVLASMAVGGLIVGAVAFWVADDDDAGTTQPAATSDDGGSQPVNDDSTSDAAPPADYSELYEQVRDSVVRITPSTGSPLGGGLGSGVVIDVDGYIITNYHVVEGADDVTVTFSDGTTADGRVAGTDPGNDIALVKVEAGLEQLEPAALGDSDALDIGSPVAAIGNPFGLDGTFTTGVISGLDRTLPASANDRPIRGLIQTDAAVNPGNSGGALFNLEGEVIGINTAIETNGTGGFVGVAYAVPINTPKRFLTQLTAGETVDHPRLGISGEALTDEQAAQAGVEYGVAVAAVGNGSAADEAGLIGSADGTGDIIVAIDGRPVDSVARLFARLDDYRVGDVVRLSVLRDSRKVEVTATLAGGAQ